jgi:nickel transport protein
MKNFVSLILFTLFLLCSYPPPAMAHKVTIFAYFEKDTLYSESYFANGAPVVAGTVTVADAQRKELAQGKTDADGHCNFPLPEAKGDLYLTLDASMGHKASFVVKRDGAPPDKAETAASAATAVAASGGDEIAQVANCQAMPAAISDDLRQIKHDLAKLQQRLDEPGPGQIFSGIGYILGLCGAAALVASRKK